LGISRRRPAKSGHCQSQTAFRLAVIPGDRRSLAPHGRQTEGNESIPDFRLEEVGPELTQDPIGMVSHRGGALNLVEILATFLSRAERRGLGDA
jgi:hypothetical protein